MHNNDKEMHQNRQIVGGILNKDDFNHDEKVVGGNSNFLDLLNKELEKQGGNPVDAVQEQPRQVDKPKPIKQFLKKGKRENELKNKEEENKAKK